MKISKVLLGMILVSAPSFAAVRDLKVDLTKSFADTSLNLMDDNINYPYAMVSIYFRAEGPFNVKVSKEETGDPVSCRVISSERKGSLVRVRVDSKVGTEDGSSCNYTIITGGKKATVQIYEIGT